MSMMEEREVKYTFTLKLSVIIVVFGNSFLFGYNIGCVNNPSKVVRNFYSSVLLERLGLWPLQNENTIVNNGVVENFNSGTVAPEAVVVGMSNGTTNPTYKTGNVTNKGETASQKEDPIIELLWTVNVAIFVLFGMIEAFVSGEVADYFGRKKGMMVIMVLMFLATLFDATCIPILAKSYEGLILHTAFVGLHSGIFMSLADLYLAEISPWKIRGAVGSIQQLFITIGILWSKKMETSVIAGKASEWPWMLAFNGIPALVCMIGFLLPLCPESPRYLLVKKGNEQEARDALRKLRGYQDVEDENDKMKVEAKKSQSVKEFLIKELLTTPDLKVYVPVYTCIVSVILMLLQYSGIGARSLVTMFHEATSHLQFQPYGAELMIWVMSCIPLIAMLHLSLSIIGLAEKNLGVMMKFMFRMISQCKAKGGCLIKNSAYLVCLLIGNLPAVSASPSNNNDWVASILDYISNHPSLLYAIIGAVCLPVLFVLLGICLKSQHWQNVVLNFGGTSHVHYHNHNGNVLEEEGDGGTIEDFHPIPNGHPGNSTPTSRNTRSNGDPRNSSPPSRNTRSQTNGASRTRRR